MDNYPDYQTYRALYAKYYHGRDVTELLQLLEPLEGMRLLDLCGGDGRLSNKAITAGARMVTLVDAEAAMIPLDLRQHGQIRVVICDVRPVLSLFLRRNEQFDRIVCQQAVNYWLDKNTAEGVALTLNSGGIFAFNTFNEKPSVKPRVLQYELAGHTFVEASWLVDDKVHHVQMRDGLEPHYTVFKWLSPETLRDWLEPHFIVCEERRGKTSLYKCTKK